jgi:hypothetical protein
MSPAYFSEDIIDFLYLLSKYEVKYLIVGGEAVIYYGHARLTGDIDIFYDKEPENVERLFQMLNEFWNNDVPGIGNKKELLQKGAIFQFGLPPNRIDLINNIEKTDFKVAWENKEEEIMNHKGNEFKIYYIGLRELIENKKAINRYKDKEDLKFLKELSKKNKN